jgi:hypothetical protein
MAKPSMRSSIISAGQTSAVFNVGIVDDDRLDGTHSTEISASSLGYIATSGSISVEDNESANLTVTLPTGLYEGNQGSSGIVTVSRPVAVMVPVAVPSSDPAKMRVAPNAYIPAGETNGTFWIVTGDNSLMDGPRPVMVTAHVPNWIDGSATTTVSDNDTTGGEGGARVWKGRPRIALIIGTSEIGNRKS